MTRNFYVPFRHETCGSEDCSKIASHAHRSGDVDDVQRRSRFAEKIITGNKLCMYDYDIQTKAQLYQWKRPEEPRPKKALQVRSNVMALLTVFFYCNGMVPNEHLPQGLAINEKLYLVVMCRLCEAFRQKCTELWKNQSWILKSP